MMISIIDDDPSVRNALLLLLQSTGFEARAFPSAEDFQKHLLINNDDCIILDLRMPGMHGFDLMEILISEGIHTPVIYLTAFDDEKAGNGHVNSEPLPISRNRWMTRRSLMRSTGLFRRERRKRLEAVGKLFTFHPS